MAKNESSSVVQKKILLPKDLGSEPNLPLTLTTQDFVVGSAIQASGMVVFEDVLRTVAW